MRSKRNYLRNSIGVLASAGILLFGSIAPAQTVSRSPQDLLIRLSLEGPSLSFSARKVFQRYRHGEEADPSKIQIHHASSERIRVERLDDSENVVRTSIFSDGRWDGGSRRTHPWVGWFGSSLVGTLDTRSCATLVRNNYELLPLEKAQIEGRSCDGIRIVPREPGRPSLELWVDQEYPLALMAIKYSHDGKIVYKTWLEDVDFNPEFVSSLFDPLAEPGSTRPEEEISEAEPFLSFKVFFPSSLPGGFELVGANVFQYRGTARLQLFYSDGIARISVYERTKESPDDQGSDSPVLELETNVIEKRARRERVLFSWEGSGTHTIVIGDLSEEIMESFVLSFWKVTRPGSKAAPEFVEVERRRGRGD